MSLAIHLPYAAFRKLTIITRDQSPERLASEPLTPETVALALLGWILGDGDRAERLLALTGLTPDILRERLNDRGVLAAVVEFLLAHEPDLIKAAEDLHITPEAIVSAHQQLIRSA